MDKRRGLWVRRASLARCWTWSWIGKVFSVSCFGDSGRDLGPLAWAGRSSRSNADIRFRLRCTTACLLTFLSTTYQQYSLIFMFLITLDFSSHYIHMYS